MKLTEKQIEDIAGNLDIGMRCFYNFKTDKIEILPGYDPGYDDQDELTEKELKLIEENQDDYYEFDRFDSYESYQIMSDFSEQIEDFKLQENLFRALNKSKPFRNFKWLIDNSGEYRQQWFDFKKQRYIQYVKDQIRIQENLID